MGRRNGTFPPPGMSPVTWPRRPTTPAAKASAARAPHVSNALRLNPRASGDSCALSAVDSRSSRSFDMMSPGYEHCLGHSTAGAVLTWTLRVHRDGVVGAPVGAG